MKFRCCGITQKKEYNIIVTYLLKSQFLYTCAFVTLLLSLIISFSNFSRTDGVITLLKPFQTFEEHGSIHVFRCDMM